MEDWDFDEVFAEGLRLLAEEKAAEEAERLARPPLDTNRDIIECVMALPWSVLRLFLSIDPGEIKNIPVVDTLNSYFTRMGIEGPVATRAAHAAAVAAIPVANHNMPMAVIARFVSKGGYSGRILSDWAHLNNHAALSGQLEFSAVGHGPETAYRCERAGYISTPFIGGVNRIGIVRMLFRQGQNLIDMRKYPAVVQNALKGAHAEFPVTALARGIISRTTPAVLAKTRHYHSFLNDLPDAYANKIVETITAIDNTVLIRLLPPEGIFRATSDSFSELFAAAAYDGYDCLNHVRVLPSLPFSGFVGEIGDMAVYAPVPLCLKVRRAQYTFVKHTVLPFDDFGEYPPNPCLMFSPMPAHIEAFYQWNNEYPAAIAIIVTSIDISNDVLAAFASTTECATIRLAFCAQPFIVFERCAPDHARAVRLVTFIKHFKVMEKYVVYACMENLKAIALGRRASFFWRVATGPLFSPTRADMTLFRDEDMEIHYFRAYPVTIKEAERKAFVPRIHNPETGIRIDGLDIPAAVPAAEDRGQAFAPRVVPPKPVYFNRPTPLLVGDVYTRLGVKVEAVKVVNTLFNAAPVPVVFARQTPNEYNATRHAGATRPAAAAPPPGPRPDPHGPGPVPDPGVHGDAGGGGAREEAPHGGVPHARRPRRAARDAMDE